VVDPEERPETYHQLYDYCKGDVDVMRKALAALPPYHWVMPAKEERLAVLTDKMNDLGVEVDLKASRWPGGGGGARRRSCGRSSPKCTPASTRGTRRPSPPRWAWPTRARRPCATS
jgi:hypothetical protein